MSAFAKVEQHVLSDDIIPFSTRLVRVRLVPFLSDPGPRNDQCPCGNLRAYPATVKEFAIHKSLFSSLLQTMSLNTDMKMIRSVNCSGSHSILSIIF